MTICIKDRKNILSKITTVGADNAFRPKQNDYEIILTSIGKIIEKCLIDINKIYKNVYIDKYVIMPNHIHGIIKIEGGQSRPPLQKIIQGFKSVTTRRCFEYGYRHIWQRNYYEHIIRNEKEYESICKYIDENPIKNEQDI